MNKKSKLIIDGKTFYKQKMLGRGAYGKVFKVTDDEGNAYAIKRVDYNEKDGVYPDIIKEMDFLRRFSTHPNIIELCGYKWDNQLFTVLMEFGGIPMHKFIDIYRYEYRMEMLPEILWQLLLTLAYLHKHKACHRDIKPDNILIDEKTLSRPNSSLIEPPQSDENRPNKRLKSSPTPTDLDELHNENSNENTNTSTITSTNTRTNNTEESASDSTSEDIEITVKLCDFGLSKTLVLKRNTPKTSTLWYRSPENLVEMKEYSTKIDIWALGCVIYEYVTDEVLFEAETTKDTLMKVLRTFGPLPDRDLMRLQIDKSSLPKKWKRHVIKEFDDVVLWNLTKQCLTIHPEDRPSAEALLRHEYFTTRGYCIDEYNMDLEEFIVKDEYYRVSDPFVTHTNLPLLQAHRKSVLDWIFTISTLENVELRPHTIFLGIELFDRAMQKWDVDIIELKQLKYIAIASLDIASKFLEIYSVDLQRVYEHNNKQHYQRLRKEYDANPAAFKEKPIPPRITRDDIKEFTMKVNKYEQKILHLLDFVVFSSNPLIRQNENYDAARHEIYSRFDGYND